jgi:CBS domain-containing protein
VREAASLMVDRSVNRLPVLDEGRLVGIVTRADLVAAYVRLDEDIARAIRDEVLKQTMWLDPAAFSIDVRDGVVRIGGTVDRRTTANIIERLVGISDGVVEVRSSLAWEWDDTAIEPAPAPETEPGAASVVSREHPAPLGR